MEISSEKDFDIKRLTTFKIGGRIKEVFFPQNLEEFEQILKENKDNKGLVYYDIQVFYRFNLPVIGNIALYKISGVTKSFVGSDDRI